MPSASVPSSRRAHDVGMRDVAQQASLVGQPLDDQTIARERVPHALDRDDAARAVTGDVDLPHAAASEELAELVLVVQHCSMGKQAACRAGNGRTPGGDSRAPGIDPATRSSGTRGLHLTTGMATRPESTTTRRARNRIAIHCAVQATGCMAPTMALVPGEGGVHAGRSVMLASRLVTRLRGLAIISAVWTLVALFSALSLYLRVSSGEIAPPPGWFWVTLAVIPIWTAATPPIVVLSRRFPLERGTWAVAVVLHALALVVVLALDGLVNLWLSPGRGARVLTFWQQMWRYSFVDAFFYGGVVAVEHAARYYRLYLDRRVHASELEAQVSRAQLQALQMQIRPHFLFNTLNTISGLVRIDDKAAAITMLAGLGDLLRLLLRSDGAQEVPVRAGARADRALPADRAGAVRRPGSRSRLSVEPGVEDALVPNLILQPLVENAVRHGIGAATGRVAVRGRPGRLDAADGGVATAATPSARDADSLGIGLTNTRARLERLYGGVHRFELAQGAAGDVGDHRDPAAPRAERAGDDRAWRARSGR